MRIRVSPGRERLVAMILGVLLGALFLGSAALWYAPAEQSECLRETAALEDWQTRGGRVREVVLRLSGGERRRVDGSCVTEELLEGLEGLHPGDEVSLLLHPRSRLVMELASEGRTLLRYAQARDALRGRARGYRLLGVICLLGAACALAGLCLKRRLRR